MIEGAFRSRKVRGAHVSLHRMGKLTVLCVGLDGLTAENYWVYTDERKAILDYKRFPMAPTGWVYCREDIN